MPIKLTGSWPPPVSQIFREGDRSTFPARGKPAPRGRMAGKRERFSRSLAMNEHLDVPEPTHGRLPVIGWAREGETGTGNAVGTVYVSIFSGAKSGCVHDQRIV